MTDSLGGTINREMFIAADPATVFAFFTDPDKMTRWMGVRSDLEPRDGGVYLVDVNHQNVARGAFEEVTPNSRLIFTFGWEDGAFGITPGSSRIQIDLEPRTAVRSSCSFTADCRRSPSKPIRRAGPTIMDAWRSRLRAAIPAPIPR